MAFLMIYEYEKHSKLCPSCTSFKAQIVVNSPDAIRAPLEKSSPPLEKALGQNRITAPQYPFTRAI